MKFLKMLKLALLSLASSCPPSPPRHLFVRLAALLVKSALSPESFHASRSYIARRLPIILVVASPLDKELGLLIFYPDVQ